jgi:hypothetical protein
LVTAEHGGTVTLEIRPGQQAYGASEQHGVTTMAYGQWRRSFVFVSTGGQRPTSGQDTAIAKVSVLSSGKLLLNGSASSLGALDGEFQRLEKAKGSVWYYREESTAEPPPEATAVVQLIIKYSLPVSLSTKADFSDYVDSNGTSVPRR